MPFILLLPIVRGQVLFFIESSVCLGETNPIFRSRFQRNVKPSVIQPSHEFFSAIRMLLRL